MNSSDVTILASSIIILATSLLPNDPDKKKKRKGQGPDRKWIKRHDELGAMNTLIREFQFEDPASYKFYFRMDEECFSFILNLIRMDITKSDTKMRSAIRADERLAITLKFLATGMSFKDLSCIFRVGERTVSNIVLEVTEALGKHLKYTFKWPKKPEDWREIASLFWLKCNLPNCIGAIDGKHITIRKPFHGGSHYHNYKGSESIVLMAIVDPNYLFRFIDVGVNGRISDGGVWDKCRVSHLLQQNLLSLPEEEFLPGSGEKTPYYFVADAAFPLSTNIMKPFPDKGLTSPQSIYNYRLCRGRRIVECAFGVLASRFRIFYTSIALQPEFVKKLVVAACSLHNFLAEKSPQYLQVSEESQLSNSNLLPLPPHPSRNPTTRAKTVRSKLSHYFLTDAGRVSWQYEAAHVA